MNLYSTASLVASTTCLLLGFFIFSKDPKNLLNQSFALIIGLTGIWSLFPFVASLPLQARIALTLTRVLYLFASFVPAAWCFFVLVLLKVDKIKTEQQTLRVLFWASTIFAVLSFTPNFIQGLVREQPFFGVIPGLSYVPFVLFFGIGCSYGYYRCYKSYAKSVGSKRNHRLRLVQISQLSTLEQRPKNCSGVVTWRECC